MDDSKVFGVFFWQIPCKITITGGCTYHSNVRLYLQEPNFFDLSVRRAPPAGRSKWDAFVEQIRLGGRGMKRHPFFLSITGPQLGPLFGEEVNVKGSEVASRSGFAPVGLAARPSGEIAWRRRSCDRSGLVTGAC